MDVAYLEPPELGTTAAGWYVVENNRILAGPFETERDAEDWIEDNKDEPSLPWAPSP